jgi:large subunit ribosomal protein L21
MYAVIRAGGKQYRVAPGDVVRLEKLAAGDDGKVQFDVLAVSSSDGEIGPGQNAQVTGQVLEQGRASKILVFHYKRKKQYKKLQGHRQAFSAVRITQITVDGQTFNAPEIAARPQRGPKAEEGGAAPEAAIAPKKKAEKGGSKMAKRGSAAGAGSKTAGQYAGTTKATGSKSKGGTPPSPKK